MASDLVFSMAITPDGNLWLASSRSGLICYDPRQRRVTQTVTNNPFRANSLLGNHLSKVFADSRGLLWVNIEPKGVDLIFPDSLTLGKFEDDLLDPNDFNLASIRGISQDRRGDLWVGSSGEGVRKVTAQGTIRRYGAESGFNTASVRGIMTDQEGTVWISTASGLMKVPPGTDRATTVPLAGADPARTNYLKGVMEVSRGDYLIATMGGLFSHNHRRTKLLTDPREGYSGAMYYHEPSGQLWVGRSEKDLRCYALRPDSLAPLYDILPGYSILSIVPDRSRSGRLILWLGTDNGLVQFDASAKKIMRIFSTHDGLPDRVVYSTMFDDAGGLWVSTNKGLALLNPNGQFQRIRQSEGIEFNSFAHQKTSDGRLFFGSTQGLFYLRPAALNRPSARGLRVLGLRVNDSMYQYLPTRPAGVSLKFQHRQNDLTFELAALDYLSDIPPIYEYRLTKNRSNESWVSNGSLPLVRFQNLPPGFYTVAFRALDANGLYTETQSIDFLIHYPYWQRWWFITLLVALGSLLFYGLLKIYLRRQHIAHQKLVSRVIKAQESERLRIAMDIHDDVNNTLAAAKGYLQPETDGKEQSPQAQHIKLSHALILKATEDLRAITHDLMPIQFEQQKLPVVIAQKVQEWNGLEGPQFSYISAGHPVKMSGEAEQMIYRIISEMVQNIRKHSQAKTAIIQLIYQESYLVVSVEDDGVGFNQKMKAETRGIGLKNIHSRAEYLKADLQISSDKKGVLIQLTVPYAPNRSHPRPLGG